VQFLNQLLDELECQRFLLWTDWDANLGAVCWFNEVESDGSFLNHPTEVWTHELNSIDDRSSKFLRHAP
jgi:hypothetical protein